MKFKKAKEDEILNAIKQILNSDIKFYPRDKELRTAAKYGLRTEDLYDFSKTITKEDYYAGPNQGDKNSKDMVWEWKKDLILENKTIKMYIKFIIVNKKNIVIDFCHEDNI
ncbi:MAG: hypothetical protein ACI4TZ_03235 [Christensenellales bacterium]